MQGRDGRAGSAGAETGGRAPHPGRRSPPSARFLRDSVAEIVRRLAILKHLWLTGPFSDSNDDRRADRAHTVVTRFLLQAERMRLQRFRHTATENA